MKTIDLTALQVVSAKDVAAAVREGATEVTLRPRAVVTPSARDALRRHGCAVHGDGQAPSPAPSDADSVHAKLFLSPQAEAVKAEIVAAGGKLWQRQYVDGNGGNISFRLAENAVLCTPTLVSKADLRPEDLCLVDLEGKQIAGKRARTSEILMHLEIYKAVPEAKAVLHCHPPHATAYAITGRVPPTCVIPEFEVFVGGVALARYETPGTQAFADAVLPYVRKHNTVLLQNHGIVCWADTVTHAEWYAEVVDTYCWTLMLASQLGAPITFIPQEKTADLLAIKKRLGLPDARLDGGMRECQLCDLPDMPGAIAVPPPSPAGACRTDGEDVEAIVGAVTDAVMAALER
ncbi:MAG TPA: class II aldolase/adducin family protein [Vicinamibacteria bacterium]|nr:class II aldolase/adducin family protein [Vicinamibacteria bacterium]